MERGEKRRARRVQVEWPVTAITADRTMQGETTNVSTSGAFIRCQKPLRLKEECLLKLRTPSDSIKANAVVVWSNIDIYEDETIPVGMGVSFIWI